jgi:flagellar hook-associated protein 2
MSTPLFNIGGIASGLDTQAILTQLMQLERQPIVRYQQRQAALRRVDDAWGEVNTRLSAVRGALDKLRDPGDLARHVNATSSKPEALTASAGSDAATGSVSFTVEALATQHRVAATGTFSGGDELVGEGTFTITLDSGAEHTIETDGSTTLAQLASRIRGLGAGVGAQVVATVPGEHRLVLSATQTGASGAFEISGDLAGLDGGAVLQAGADAHLRLGTLDVYRASNTVTDLVDGVTLTLTGVSAEPVTVTVERDVEAAAASVTELVDAVNALLDRTSSLSSYNPETRLAGPLQGDSTLRRLVTDVRAALSLPVDGLDAAFGHGSAIGLGLTRDGRIELDQARLREALTEDFDGVVALLARSGTTTDPRVTFAAASSDTAPGTYEVTISRAAAIASATGTGYFPAVGEPKTFTVTTSGGQVMTVQIDTGDVTAEMAVAKIEAALQQAGVTSVRVRRDGDQVTFEHREAGSANGFEITGGEVFGIADGAYDGEDVAGTIDGLPATGRGRLLTGAEGATAGLVLAITATQEQVDTAGGTLAAGTVTFTKGLGGALHGVLATYEGSLGRIADARQSLSAQIRRFDDSIAAFEERVAGREVTLRRQFTALESAMGQLQAQSAWMASQLASMAAV